MDDFGVLRELLRDDAVVRAQRGAYGKPEIVLSEPQTEGFEGYEVRITKVPEEAIALKVDKFPAPEHIFKGSQGECKRADFLIIIDGVMVFIELQKSNDKSEKEIICQFKGAQCFVDYCRGIGEKFWNKNGFLGATGYVQYFVSINHINVDKRPTRSKRKPNIKPEDMLKISSPGENGLQFRSLTVES